MGRTIRSFEGVNTRNIMFKILGPSNALGVRRVGRLVRTTKSVSIALRETFSMYISPVRAVRRTVSLKVGAVLASNRHGMYLRKTSLLGRLMRGDRKHVAVRTKDNIKTRIVHRLCPLAKIETCRVAKGEIVSDRVRFHGSKIGVKLPVLDRCRV